MANYPTGIFAPAAKNTGDVIQAAHVTDLEAEVIALETGLKNGLQHALTVSTGGLTVSTGATVLGGSLSVAGGSTLGAVISTSLDVTGNSTFHGPVTFSSGVTFSVAPTFGTPRVNVKLSGSTDIASNAWTGLNWDIQRYDSHGMHSTSANSSRLTFANSTGVYHVGASVDIRGAANLPRRIRLMVNDSSGVAASAVQASDTLAFLCVSADVRAGSTSDYITCQVYSKDSTANVRTSTEFETVFWAHKVLA